MRNQIKGIVMKLEEISQLHKCITSERASAFSPNIVQRTKSKIAKNKRGIEGAPKEMSVMPKSISIVGITPGGGEQKRAAVIRTSVNGRAQLYSLSVAELTAGEFKALSAMFVEAGCYDLNENAKLKLAAKEIIKVGATKKALILNTPGLNEIEVGKKIYSAYVWGREHYWFGDKPDARVVVANDHSHIHASCALAEWKTNVGRKLCGNPYLTVAHTHALAAALRRRFQKKGISVSFVGQSGIGKSTIQNSAQSQIGSIEGVITMSGTKVGIIERLLEYPDSPVFFQDINQCDRSDIFFDLIFDVADGACRMKSGQKQKKISATMLLSNERVAADMVSRKKGTIDEGLYARLFEIVCEAPHGAFHNLHGCDNAADFADELSRNSERLYGAVWPAWIQALSENWPAVSRLYEKWFPIVKARIAKRAGEAANGRVNNRILDALSFSAWAGCIASRFKILPVKRSEIVEAYGIVMKEHLDRQKAGTTPLADQLVTAVMGCIDESPARFPSLASFNDASNANIYGYRWKSKSKGDVILFLPSVFIRLFIEKFGSNAYGIIKQSGYLVTTTGRGYQYQVKIPGTKDPKSFIAISEKIRFDKN